MLDVKTKDRCTGSSPVLPNVALPALPATSAAPAIAPRPPFLVSVNTTITGARKPRTLRSRQCTLSQPLRTPEACVAEVDTDGVAPNMSSGIRFNVPLAATTAQYKEVDHRSRPTMCLLRRVPGGTSMVLVSGFSFSSDLYSELIESMKCVDVECPIYRSTSWIGCMPFRGQHYSVLGCHFKDWQQRVEANTAMAGSMPTDIVERVLQCNEDANRGKKKVVPALTQPPTQALPTPMNPYAGWPMPPWAPPPYQAALHQAALQPPTLPLAAVATARGSSPLTIT
ncbi:uncharacterized protein MYCGRDRAFT_97869 [Zymoseptoria tritici IPO323]|uniref:Uncharacterized protein n=1 Tax=Zymoseptoria tritici (strain CBS 115943 / IPO323) TaxID=336722 RepID=F9XRM4_ZYMTI|nr:uncharacterized protein MYCGRDRAFT_97869 [Zymoseptoria tritici IPO323]EGP82103.1 hypothetical protein MYCGRDRAFT_97869 [Zymoseptoria tritici IPO323]